MAFVPRNRHVLRSQPLSFVHFTFGWPKATCADSGGEIPIRESKFTFLFLGGFWHTLWVASVPYIDFDTFVYSNASYDVQLNTL